MNYLFDNVINDILVSDIFLAATLIVFALNVSTGKTTFINLRKTSTVVYCVQPICLTIVSVVNRQLMGPSPQ